MENRSCFQIFSPSSIVYTTLHILNLLLIVYTILNYLKYLFLCERFLFHRTLQIFCVDTL